MEKSFGDEEEANYLKTWSPWYEYPCSFGWCLSRPGKVPERLSGQKRIFLGYDQSITQKAFHWKPKKPVSIINYTIFKPHLLKIIGLYSIIFPHSEANIWQIRIKTAKKIQVETGKPRYSKTSSHWKSKLGPTASGQEGANPFPLCCGSAFCSDCSYSMVLTDSTFNGFPPFFGIFKTT
jgi:hypothetical protein